MRRIAIYRKTGQSKGINRERIIRVLLNSQEGLSKYRVSKLSKTSFSWAHKYLRKLEEEGYLKGTRVVKYRELIYRWLKIHAQSRRRDYLIQEPFEFLKNVDMEYALTTYAAENLTQRHVFLSRYDVYVRREDEEVWSGKLSSIGLMGSGNFRMLVDDEHVFYNVKKVNGFTI